MRRATTGAVTGDLVPGVAEERGDSIRAVTAGLDDLETGREISFDETPIRLGLGRNEAP